MRTAFALALTLTTSLAASAAVKTETVTYTFDGVEFKGFLAYPDDGGKHAGVLVCHEWWGLNAHAKERTEELAKMGYVAFAGDMYGGGKTTEHPQDAGGMATAVRNNKEVWRGRAKAALKVLADNPHVDPHRLAAIGYCFGGSTALQLAYTGADLKAVATFHAALPAPTPAEAKAIKAKILVCHGADDPFVTKESVEKFKAALAAGGVDLKYEEYPGVVHSFTAKGADQHMIKGMKYDAAADHKSWATMKALFADTIDKK